MDKISHIVRSSARVVSPPDIKSERNTRPGAPVFGRPTTNEAVNNPQEPTKKPATHEGIVQQSSESFFMTRARPTAAQAVAPEKVVDPGVVHEMELAARESTRDAVEELNGPHAEEIESIQPSGFVPRGSYVNLHA